eukprot:1140394-Pelagomonas_calceolata.AAC.2
MMAHCLLQHPPGSASLPSCKHARKKVCVIGFCYFCVIDHHKGCKGILCHSNHQGALLCHAASMQGPTLKYDNPGECPL